MLIWLVCIPDCVFFCCSVQPHLLRRRGPDVRPGDQAAAGGPAALRVSPQLHGGGRRVRRPGAGECQTHPETENPLEAFQTEGIESRF